MLANDCFSNLEIIAKESIDLLESGGFKLRKWVSKRCAKSILTKVPCCDLAPLSEIDLRSQLLPDSKALELVWNIEQDRLLVNYIREFCEESTRRQMSSQLANQFDPLGMASPFILEARLILQKVSTSGADWNDALPEDIRYMWKKWLFSLNKLNDFSIPRYSFVIGETANAAAVYQLHDF